MDSSDSNFLWSLLQDNSSDNVINNNVNVTNANFMSPYPYSSPRSHLSTVSMDSGLSSGIESPSHNANNQQSMTDETQIFLNYQQQQFFDNSINDTSNYPNVLALQNNTCTITYPSTSDVEKYCSLSYSELQKPELKIVEEPKTIFRYRYETEMQGPHGTIQARPHCKNQKVFPTVMLQNYEGNAKVKIKCSLYQYEKNCEIDYLHPHKLVMRTGDGDIDKKFDPHFVEVTRQNDYTAVFQGLGIIQTKKHNIEEVLRHKMTREKIFELQRQLTEDESKAIKENVDKITKKVNINQVRLGYTAYIQDERNNKWMKLCGPVFSTVINNKKSGKVGDLKICKMSTFVSEADGNQEIFMFVSKVDKNTIKVRFFETKDGEPHGEVVWDSLGRFNPSDVHHQFGIVLRSPPYKDRYIENNVNVFVQLFRSTDGETSDPLIFTYKSNSHNRMKRRRADDSMTPTVVEQYESPSVSRDFSSSNTASLSSTYANQNLFFNINTNTANQQQEEAETDLNVLLTLVTTEFCSDKLAESELIRYCLGNENDLVLDAATPAQMENKHSSPPELKLSTLEKLKLIMKVFGKNLSEEKMHDLMMAVIEAAEERDENILIDVMQYGTMNDIKELVLIMVKYKLNDILKSKNEIGQNALHLSIILGYENLLKVFIKLGIDVNEPDTFGLTSLHVAVQENSITMVENLLKSNSILLDNFDDNGYTPLSLSVMNNNMEIAKLLISAGADTHKANPTNGFTCLHIAINNNQTINREMIDYLIDVNRTLLTAESNEGMNVLKMAIVNNSSKDFIDHLKSFYTDSGEKEASDETEVFDDECLNELCEIFDKNDSWKIWVERMDLTENIDDFASAKSPSRALFQYLINAKKTLHDIIELLELTDDDEKDCAINAINEMVIRKFNI